MADPIEYQHLFFIELTLISEIHVEINYASAQLLTPNF